MGLLTRTLAWVLTLAMLMASAMAVLLFLDSHPRVPEERGLTAAERGWAQEWLRAARPRDQGQGEPVTLTLTEPEANLLLAYLIDRFGAGRARIRLLEDRAQIVASLGLPLDPVGRFVNLELELSGSGRPPRIERLRLAGLPMPESLAQGLAGQALETLDQGHLLQSLQIAPGRILVTYAWHPNALADLGRGLLPPALWESLLVYQDQIRAETRALPKGPRIQLAPLLARLLAQAGDRSQGGDPALENQAAILALAAYVNRRDLSDPSGISEPGSGPRPRAADFRPVVLRGRVDLAQHFMTSAAVATQGGETLSELLGLYKEIADSRGGSGFSFADLAADRAGNRFALSAAGDAAGARATQVLARRGLAEDDFMPTIEGLPEGLSRGELAAGFGNPQDPAHRRLARAIERDIDALPVHRQGSKATCRAPSAPSQGVDGDKPQGRSSCL